MSSGEKQKP